jgi:hypothetical protein
LRGISAWKSVARSALVERLHKLGNLREGIAKMPHACCADAHLGTLHGETLAALLVESWRRSKLTEHRERQDGKMILAWCNDDIGRELRDQATNPTYDYEVEST